MRGFYCLLKTCQQETVFCFLFPPARFLCLMREINQLSANLMKQIRLKIAKRPARVIFGHPWVFAGEIETPPKIEDGTAAELLDFRGRSLGSGIWSGKSQIVWRRFTRNVCEWDANFLSNALAKAVSRRNPALACQRLVWSEADSIPGLVVDKFESTLVVQALTAGADKQLPAIAEWLARNLAPAEIIFRNDAPSRRLEGLESSITFYRDAPHKPRWFKIDGLEYFLDLANGQKTGFYLDQREQHSHVAQRYAAGKTVLDACCNQGGFAMQCARAGAAEIYGVDISAPAIDACRQNCAQNKIANAQFEVANLFDWFGANRERKFDLIILDPPPFARSKSALEGALRGYKELNLRALKMLTSGGILATYSCSQRVGLEQYIELLSDAARDAHRDVRLLEITGQPADHPCLLNFPESHYLKGLILQA